MESSMLLLFSITCMEHNMVYTWYVGFTLMGGTKWDMGEGNEQDICKFK